jgi:hypothetical protein
VARREVGLFADEHDSGAAVRVVPEPRATVRELEIMYSSKNTKLPLIIINLTVGTSGSSKHRNKAHILYT